MNKGNNEPKILNSEEIQDYLNKAKFTVSNDIGEQIICLTIEQEDKTSNICSLGNISMITGKAKSRKTYLVTAITGALLTNQTFLNFTCKLPESKRKILYIDTEQSLFDTKRILNRIIKIAGLNESDQPGNLDLYRFRNYEPTIILPLIEYLIYNTENLGFVIIDGIKDTLYSINDERESTEISRKLLKWSEEKQIHILTVLHQNKTDNNSRGHIGTELNNKCETVLIVEKHDKDKKVSVIKSETMRSIEFDFFAFGIDENDIPYLADGIDISSTNNKKGLEPHEIADQTHINDILKPIYEINSFFSYSMLWQEIQKAYSRYSTIGNNRAKEFMSYYKTKEFVIQKGKYYYLNENLPGLISLNQ